MAKVSRKEADDILKKDGDNTHRKSNHHDDNRAERRHERDKQSRSLAKEHEAYGQLRSCGSDSNFSRTHAGHPATTTGSNPDVRALSKAEKAATQGPRHPKRQESRHESKEARLLIVSSKVKNHLLIQTAVLGGITIVQYRYESASLDTILSSVSQHLGDKLVESIAFLAHGSPVGIHVTNKDDRTVSKESIQDQKAIKDFLLSIVNKHLDKRKRNARMDFLGCGGVPDSSTLEHEAEKLLSVPVGISKDISGPELSGYKPSGDTSKPMCVGELYFRMERLRWAGHNGNQQSLAGFERIRTVGKGAYGTAVLYRKKDDDSLVILKEINLHDLSASERHMAFNEIRVLAMLDHPNIISYYDSFEEDGIIMIEMEYADGGTLSQYLTAQDKPLEEREILNTFAQIVSAIKYTHEHNVLHRDMKTANVFLTKEGQVKVGDFGISKLVSTAHQDANTVLGTPYYISPEMCEGKPYRDKSDIWALGCILYEMACLQKTFEGSNLPALVNKIMKGQFAPVKGDYSPEFINLIMEMLQREPEYRPSAAEIWNTKLPDLMAKYVDEDDGDAPGCDEELMASSENAASKKSRSVVYYFTMEHMQLTPIHLPSRMKIRDVAVGNDHVIVVSMERTVYTWGEGSKGQLGHGDLEGKSTPTLVEALKGKSIVRVCCGDGFSVFGSDNGIVMTCGDGVLGSLGHGDWCSTSRPRLIEALLSIDVVSISCGAHHVAAVGSDGEVFTWGKGTDGQLGLGSTENQCQPMEVAFSEPVNVRECRCGRDGTMLLTDVGSVLACGNNEHNKLGLNQRAGFLIAMKNMFNKTEVPGVKIFTVVKALCRYRVMNINMGPAHSAVIVESGQVFTFGKNNCGQLGTGNTKVQYAPIVVNISAVTNVRCSENFTIAGTVDNDLWIWGTRRKRAASLDDSGGKPDDIHTAANTNRSSSRSHSRQPSTVSVGSIGSAKEIESISSFDESNGSNNANNESRQKSKRQESVESVFSSNSELKDNGSEMSPGFRPISSTPRRSSSSGSHRVNDDTELILQPTPLLRMDSSGTHSRKGDTVTLSQFFSHGENLCIQVETTAPPPRRRSRKKKSYLKQQLSSRGLDITQSRNQFSASSRDGGDEYSSETSEMDNTTCSIPNWLKQELANSEMEETSKNKKAPADGNGHSDDEGDLVQDSSMSSIHINRSLKPKSNTQRHSVPRDPTSPESGIEAGQTDPLSSSSSSENMPGALCTTGVDARSKVFAGSKKLPLVSIPVKKVGSAAPVPQKSKNGPTPVPKPIARIRAQRPTRRSDPPTTTTSSSEREAKSKQDNIERLQTELQKLHQEKQRIDQHVKNIEEQQNKQHQQLKKEAEKKASSRETELKEEITHLRKDLSQQNRKMEANYNVVMSLQAEIELLKSEQAKQRPESRQSVRESRICSVQ